MNIFVYATLKKHRTQVAAMHHKASPITFDILPGYKEITLEVNDKSWPTVVEAADSQVKGDLLTVSQQEAWDLDRWEDKYKRRRVILKTGKEAWVYALEIQRLGSKEGP